MNQKLLDEILSYKQGLKLLFSDDKESAIEFYADKKDKNRVILGLVGAKYGLKSDGFEESLYKAKETFNAAAERNSVIWPYKKLINFDINNYIICTKLSKYPEYNEVKDKVILSGKPDWQQVLFGALLQLESKEYKKNLNFSKYFYDLILKAV